MLPLVAIVGRPNVGKSSLFNRIVGRRKALVQDIPGITRDRHYAEADWDGCHFRIVDTGGLEFAPQTSIEDQMAKQALLAVEEADLILLMMDGRAGVTTLDQEWVQKVRRIKKPKFFIINKIDAEKEEPLLSYFYELGMKDLIPVSAEIGRGVATLLDRILAELKLVPERPLPVDKKVVAAEIEEDSDAPLYGESTDMSKPINLAIIGRPNVGKSTLLNQLCGWERAIVHNSPGTTRDPVDTAITLDDQEYRIIDTAGIRKRGKTNESIEVYSVIKSLKTMASADIVLFVIDSIEGVTEQDAHVAGEAFKLGKIIIVLINKWDEAQKDKDKEAVLKDYARQLPFMEYAPVFFISAKTGAGIKQISPCLKDLWRQANIRLPEEALRDQFEYWVEHHPPPVIFGKNIVLKNIRQQKGRPPLFIIKTAWPKKIHFSYERYIINCIRENFALKHVPIRLIFRKAL